MNRRRTFTSAICAAACATLSIAVSGAALAQAYPNKPIKVIVPFAPGSATDQIGRGFAAKMAEALPGANGTITLIGLFG